MTEQRRQAERLPLDPPLEAVVGEMPVKVVELSMIGCRIHHAQRLAMGSAVKLAFETGAFQASGRVVRSVMLSPDSYESGLTFIGTPPPELRRFLEEKVDAAPIPDVFAQVPFLKFGDEGEYETPSLPYVECILTPSGWQRKRVATLVHPKEGFTMLLPDGESEQELDLYCRTFEVADEETRRLIRLSFDLAAHR